MTDELEHTRGVLPALPPELVEPPAPTRAPERIPESAVAPKSEAEPEAELEAQREPGPRPPSASDAAAVDVAPPASRRPYRVRMTDGVVVALDLTVYLGRKPSVPRIASDRRVRLVAVPSVDKQVSATHLELRQTGDAVVATDMRSTNGSTVIVPGSKPHTLLHGESAVVTPGTLIDLGDANVLEILSPERLTADSATHEEASA